MRIIKPGKLPQDEVLKGVCNNCGCEFQFQVSEVIKILPVGAAREYYQMKCPQAGCHAIVMVLV